MGSTWCKVSEIQHTESLGKGFSQTPRKPGEEQPALSDWVGQLGVGVAAVDEAEVWTERAGLKNYPNVC